MDNVEIMDIQTQMGVVEKEIEEQFLVLGKEVFKCIDENNHNLAYLRGNYEKIKIGKEKLERLQMDINKIQEEKNRKEAVAAGGCVCPKCHTTYITPVNFCKHCGYNFNQDEKPQAIVCPKCGTSYDSPMHFCKECGYDLSTVEAEKPEEKPAPVAAPTTYVCSKCGAHYDEGYKFCKECGGQVVAEEPVVEEPVAPVYVCSQCGIEYEPGYKFCKECGGKIIEK